MINLGEKIKTLRVKSGRTQEELASAVGVTAQAVSRWENTVCYPDVELIPPIANYFGITTDELLGVNCESDDMIVSRFRQEISTESDLSVIKSIINEYHHQYPGCFPLLERIVWVICREYSNDSELIDLAVTVGKRILSECTDTKIRRNVQKSLAFVCDFKKAEEFIDCFDDTVLLRSNIIGRRIWNEGRYDKAQPYFDVETFLVFRYICTRSPFCGNDTNKAISRAKLIIEFLKTIGDGNIPDGWLDVYGLNLVNMSAAYFKDGHKELGYESLEEAASVYEKMYLTHPAEHLPVGGYGLFDNVTVSVTGREITVYAGELEYKLVGFEISEHLNSEAFNTVIDEPRFKDFLSRLKELDI